MADQDIESRKITPTVQNPGASDSPVPPSLMQKVWNFFTSDPSGMGLVDLPPAIAVTPATVPIFKAAMENAPKITGNPLVDKMIAWMSTRYPRFTGQVPIKEAVPVASPGMSGHFVFDPATGVETLPANVYGQWSVNAPAQRAISGVRGQVTVNPLMIAATKGNIDDTIGETINTAAHELTHARQGTRYANALKVGNANMWPELQGVSGLENMAGTPYENRIVEKFANQGGATAKASWMKYRALLESIGEQSPNIPMMDVLVDMYRRGVAIPK